jgi:predicted methyltransferase
MIRRDVLWASLCALLPGAASAAEDTIAAALADPARPAQDRAADLRRHPAEVLKLAGVRPGMQVAELFPGGNYFSRLLSRVVGPEGHVWLLPWQEPQSGRSRALADDRNYGNLSFFGGNPLGFRPPRPLDLVFTVQNYHDIATPQRAQVNQLIFRWLKPGGVYLLVDHSALDGSGYAGLGLHRIDEALVKREVTAAGFRLDAESQALRNPADDRRKNVFDPAIRGRTDQFMLRFVKP